MNSNIENKMFIEKPGHNLPIERVRAALRRQKNIQKGLNYVKNLEKYIVQFSDIESVKFEKINSVRYALNIDLADECKPKPCDCEKWAKARAKYVFDERKIPAQYWDDISIFNDVYALVRTRGNQCEERLKLAAELADALDNSAANLPKLFTKDPFTKHYPEEYNYIFYNIDKLFNK